VLRIVQDLLIEINIIKKEVYKNLVVLVVEFSVLLHILE